MERSRERWLGTLTLFLIVAISYVDRINIAVLITQVDFLAHLGLAQADRASQGFLATAFMVGYGLSAFVFSPFCAAIFGVRKSLLYGLGIWGVVTFVSPWFEGYGALLLSRFLLGVSEGPLFSLASVYIKAHFAAHENGKPNSWVNMGTGLGLAVGYPFVGYTVATLGWMSSFHVLGVLNILLGMPLVWAFIRMPADWVGTAKPRTAKDALRMVGNVFRGAAHTQHLFVITLLTSCAMAYLWGSGNWLPVYLKEARGFNLKELGWLASLPQYAMVCAVFLGGLLIDRIARPKVPLIFVFGSLGVAAAVWLAIRVEEPYMAAMWLTVASFFWGLQSPAIPSTVQYFSRPEHIACAFGIVNGTGSLVAAFMPALMGLIIGFGASGSDPGAGFFAGFASLIGTQLIVLLCGLRLWTGNAQGGSAPAHVR